MSEELNFYRAEIATLRDEKTDLEQNLAKKTSDIRNGLENDVLK